MDSTVKDLIDGISGQTKHTNSLWTMLVVLAVVVILPSQDTSGLRTLPFNLGTIPNAWFYLVATLLLAVLYIAFASAHVQIARAHELAQQAVGKSVETWDQKSIHPHDVFDVAVTPSLNRVGPLAKAARGRFQFYAVGHSCPIWLIRTTTIAYIFLKILSGLVYYGLPLAALIVAACRYFTSTAPAWLFLSQIVVILFLFGVLLSLVPLVMLEVNYMRRAATALWKE